MRYSYTEAAEGSPVWGGRVVLFARKACAKFQGQAHLIEVQQSLVALEGVTAVWSSEMVENVHNGRFLWLFQAAF